MFFIYASTELSIHRRRASRLCHRHRGHTGLLTHVVEEVRGHTSRFESLSFPCGGNAGDFVFSLYFYPFCLDCCGRSWLLVTPSGLTLQDYEFYYVFHIRFPSFSDCIYKSDDRTSFLFIAVCFTAMFGSVDRSFKPQPPQGMLSPLRYRKYS